MTPYIYVNICECIIFICGFRWIIQTFTAFHLPFFIWCDAHFTLQCIDDFFWFILNGVLRFFSPSHSMFIFAFFFSFLLFQPTVELDFCVYLYGCMSVYCTITGCNWNTAETGYGKTRKTARNFIFKSNIQICRFYCLCVCTVRISIVFLSPVSTPGFGCFCASVKQCVYYTHVNIECSITFTYCANLLIQSLQQKTQIVHI